MSRKRKPWKKTEFLFCFVVIWTAAVFQGYALYQEWKVERTVKEAFQIIGADNTRTSNRKGIGDFTLEAAIPGKLSLTEKKKAENRLFHSLSAQVVEAVREEDLYTVYGISPLFRETVCYGENEINLNLAFSYDETKKETKVYLAVPYIRTDY